MRQQPDDRGQRYGYGEPYGPLSPPPAPAHPRPTPRPVRASQAPPDGPEVPHDPKRLREAIKVREAVKMRHLELRLDTFESTLDRRWAWTSVLALLDLGLIILELIRG